MNRHPDSQLSNLLRKRCGVAVFTIILVAVLCGVLLLPASTAVGGEESQAFLAKLRERGYFDTASEYLEFIKESDLVDEDFKQSIPYEQAMTLVARAGTIGNRRAREKVLRQANDQFKAFAEAQPDSPRANDVRLRVSNVYLLLARAKLAALNQPGADRAAIEQQARKFYEEALAEAVDAEKVIQSTRKRVRDELTALRKAAGGGKPSGNEPRKLSKQEKDLIARRDKLRGDWMKAEFAQVKITELIVETYPPESELRKQALEKAAAAYEAMFLKHDTRLVGLICRVQQGRCLMKLGKYEEALNCFVEISDYEESEVPQLRKIWLDSHRYSIQCKIGEKKFADAIGLTESRLRKNEIGTADARAIRFLRAEAEVDLAETLGPGKQGKKKKLLNDAVKIYRTLSKSKGAWQSESQDALVALGKVVEEQQQGEPKTFDEAFSRAATAMQRRRAFSTAASKATGKEQEGLEEKMLAEKEQAFGYYQLALVLADNETLAAKLRACQSALCYLFFDRGDYLRAAIIGEYIGRQYPGSREDKFGTNVALNSWLKEYSDAGEDRDFEKERVKRLAIRISKRWPDSSEAADATGHLLTFAVREGDADAAWEYLQRVPRDSSRRGSSEINVGQLLWNRYARNQRLSEAARPTAEVLEADLQRAAELLASGLAGYEQGRQVDKTAVNGAYALAQLRISDNKPAETIAVLEQPKYGPLTLLEAKNPLVTNDKYALKTYRLALRSYIGALSLDGNNPQQQAQYVDEAFAIVNKLEQTVGNDADAESRLTKIYIDLGKDLELQIKSLQDQGDVAAKKALSNAFEMFLGQIKKRPQATTYRTMIWIAETYFTLGKSNSGDAADASVADQYYGQAAKVYQDILKRKLYKNPRQRTTIELRLAACYRGLKQFKKALDQLVTVLSRKTGNLTVQVQAAETLYDAGAEDCSNYVSSILGAEKDEQSDRNIIWGWKKLAQQTSGNEAFAPYFYQAKLYGVRARRMYAQCIHAENASKAAKILYAAKGNLLQIFNEFPDLGGVDFKPEFEAEMRQVQRALGQREVGFPQPAAEPVAGVSALR